MGSKLKSRPSRGHVLLEYRTQLQSIEVQPLGLLDHCRDSTLTVTHRHSACCFVDVYGARYLKRGRSRQPLHVRVSLGSLPCSHSAERTAKRTEGILLEERGHPHDADEARKN